MYQFRTEYDSEKVGRYEHSACYKTHKENNLIKKISCEILTDRNLPALWHLNRRLH